MAGTTVADPVEDSVPKVDGQIAVGEDLKFQRKWWRFEDGIWLFFVVILIFDLLGLFGRGYLAKAKRTASDQSMTLDYERIERASTPSIMTMHFPASSVHDGQLRVFVSESVIKELGAQRVAPQPAVSTLTDGGVLYTFAADGPAVVEIALSPSFPGRHQLRVGVAGGAPLDETVYVVP